MIISRTPFRVSLFGGGSDYPKWYLQHGGSVLGFAINKYCYITLRPLPPFFEHKHRIAYSRVEAVKSLEEIQHPSVRNTLMYMGVDYGVEIHHDGDLPARSGLGSSSAFTVGLINAIQAQAGQMSSKMELAREAIHIEQNVIKESVGSQDQVWAAFGGLNRIDFYQSGEFAVTSLIVEPRRRKYLLDHFMLFFSGFSRYAEDVARAKIANLDKKASNIERMVALVEEAQTILGDPNRSLDDIGRMLHDGWLLKRELDVSVSNSDLDGIYDAARKAGAIGGKLLGAGGGGFMLFYVDPERQPAVRDALRGLIEVQIGIDHTGSKIVLYEPDGL
jgi:D-glycero-alpha-D-manno-heptose-7-phosphate kinase